MRVPHNWRVLEHTDYDFEYPISAGKEDSHISQKDENTEGHLVFCDELRPTDGDFDHHPSAETGEETAREYADVENHEEEETQDGASTEGERNR
ncbi:MAG: hypothetical protein SXQ77_00900, partial [Halobacteria archaeon]|nr:hypothetical protein [Halobacteria archaeon]